MTHDELEAQAAAMREALEAWQAWCDVESIFGQELDRAMQTQEKALATGAGRAMLEELRRLRAENIDLQWWNKALSMLIALMPPSTRRVRAAAERLGVPLLEVAMGLGTARNAGEKLLAAWPEEGPDWKALVDKPEVQG